MTAFVEDMSAAKAAGDTTAEASTITPLAVRNWIAVRMVAEVLRGKAGSGQEITRESFLAAWQSAQSLDTGVGIGWTPGAAQTAFPGYGNVANTRSFIFGFTDDKTVVRQKEPADVLTYVGPMWGHRRRAELPSVTARAASVAYGGRSHS